MKEIVVISGKGGTGKTSLAASFAMLGGEKVTMADCDVDAADLHLLLDPKIEKSEDFYSGYLAEIDQEKCLKCGKCYDACHFSAINNCSGDFLVCAINCEGCGYCEQVCPSDAVTMVSQNVGQWYVSSVKTGGKMVHAALGIGAENSGKLVSKVKNEALLNAKEQKSDYIIVDGSPGIGCPVISSLSGADYVVVVTEPTVSGFHDLKRVYQLIKSFGIPTGCVINKADLNKNYTNKIIKYLYSEGITHIINIPYDEDFSKAITAGKTIVETDNNNLKGLIMFGWGKIKEQLN